MTQCQKDMLEAKIRVLWKRIDRCEEFGEPYDEYISELHGIKYVLEVMGYAVMCEPDGQTRRIVTIQQFANMNS